jgi:hypothetical protein
VNWFWLELAPADAVPPELPAELEPIEPEPVELDGSLELVDEPLDPDERSDAEPELLPDEPMPDDPDEPAEEPDEPDPVEPVLDWAPAGRAMSRLAIPSPATIPFPIFISIPPTAHWTNPAHAAVSRVGVHTVVLHSGRDRQAAEARATPSGWSSAARPDEERAPLARRRRDPSVGSSVRQA